MMNRTYVALLRGINVSGKNAIKMADLRAHLTALGFQNVQTYIQSGNLVFDEAKGDPKAIAEQIAKMIMGVYGFEIPTMVFEAAIWKEVYESNPWCSDESKDIAHRHVTFLSEIPSNEAMERLSALDLAGEAFHLDRYWLYLHMPNSYGRGKLQNGLLERQLKLKATTRNWKTITAILKMLD